MQVHTMGTQKGGAGKSFICSLLAQAYHRTGRAEEVECIDTDPAQGTFAEYAALGATRWNVIVGEDLDRGRLDPLLSRALETRKSFVIDSGSTSAQPMLTHIVSTGFAEDLAAEGKQLVVHAVLDAGQLSTTVVNLDYILQRFPAPTAVVVWLNEFRGPILSASGKPFEETPVYQSHKERFRAVIRVPRIDGLTTSAVQKLIDGRLTFAEAVDHPGIDRYVRKRLKTIADQVFPSIEALIA